jgi:hypothetical protein
VRVRQVILLAVIATATGAPAVSEAGAGRFARQLVKKKLVRPIVRRAPAAHRLRAKIRRATVRRHRLGRLPGRAEARRFLFQVAARERRFYQPGVSYDPETGLTFDGHPIDRVTGELRGKPRNWSAASKESLHIILLAKAVAGDEIAQALITPDPADPSQAVARALDVLGKKIATYRRFHRKNPGFAGFLPWFKVEQGEMVPMDGWTDRVPGLDNGQLAWSLYMAEGALREAGHRDLAAAYRRHLDLMARNVVDVFYDPAGRHFRGEAAIERGGGVAAGANRYGNRGYLIEDAYEGLLLVHFADLMGDWRNHPAGRDAVWREPRRKPASFRDGGERITVAEGHWFSSHEDWGFLVLPFRDVPIADRLYSNGQAVRTRYSARNGYSGLFASTHRPVANGAEELAYENSAGIQEVARDKVRTGDPIFAPYAAFPLALVDQRLFAGWMKSMLDRPGVFGPYGMGESYSDDGKTAPLLTWDGKALPMIAWMGGVSDEIRRGLQRDGTYRTFRSRVEHDYRLFRKISVEAAPFAAPPQGGKR